MTRNLISARAALAALIIVTGAISSPGIEAGEGGSSSYFPGTFGSFAVAAAPEPGWVYANYSLFYGADLDEAVLQGRVNLDLETSAYINMSAGLYTFEQPVLGGRFSIGGFLPVGRADLEADLVGQRAGISVDDSETALGDISLVPFSVYWNTGNWHFNLYELVITPTGEYDTDNVVNLGRNYWSFDTVFALTHLNMEKGREWSLITGFMINTENGDTDYKTGEELHVEPKFNQFFSETFAVGLHGYWYKQIGGDSGSGAILGDFKGESYGIGPALLWVPGGGTFSVTATWLHDLNAERRFESDYAVVTLGWQLGGGR
jgi:hypothetical protein